MAPKNSHGSGVPADWWWFSNEIMWSLHLAKMQFPETSTCQRNSLAKCGVFLVRKWELSMGLFTIGYTWQNASKSPSLHRTELPSRFDHFSVFPIICFPLLCCLFLSDAKRFKSESLNQNVGIYIHHTNHARKGTCHQKCPKHQYLVLVHHPKTSVFWQRPKKSHEVSLLCRYSGAYFQKKIVQNPVTSCSRLQQWKVPW